MIFHREKVTGYRYNSEGLVIVPANITATKICRDHNISLADLKRLNPTVNLDHINPNQTLKVNE